ncbi:hypothetical protein ACGO3R_06775 [Lactococcus lactis]
MTWTNPVLNSDGTVTGTMTYRSRNAGTDYIASTQLTVQKVCQLVLWLQLVGTTQKCL